MSVTWKEVSHFVNNSVLGELPEEGIKCWNILDFGGPQAIR